MIQKLQKIRNIRRSKEVKKQNLSFFENNPNIINIDEKIEELSQIIKPSKDKKKKKKKNRSINNEINSTMININSTHHQNSVSSYATPPSHTQNQMINLSKVNTTSIFLKKKKVYHFTEKNKKLLKIKCEPYNNVYEYFNNTKLDIKSLIYIR